MSLIDHRAGLSEMLRLCLTLSESAVDSYQQLFAMISNPQSIDSCCYQQALSLSLSIKKSVVDYDEYEKDIRRSMNYGHTFGHAIEKLVDFSIPHGLAVLFGIHMASHFSRNISLMEERTFSKISNLIRLTLNGIEIEKTKLQSLSSKQIIEQFKYDKKGDGSSVPLILLQKPGLMHFKLHHFNTYSIELENAITFSLNDIIRWLS